MFSPHDLSFGTLQSSPFNKKRYVSEKGVGRESKGRFQDRRYTESLGKRWSDP